MIREGVASYLPDIDPEETSEWLESFDELLERSGPARARYLMLRLLERAGEQRVAIPALTSTDYVNTIPTELEPWFPGDEDVERRFRALDQMERRDHGAPRAAPGRRRGRPHLDLRLLGGALRGRLQPLLPRQVASRRRGPGVHPGPRLPRHLRPRLPRGPAQRGPARRLPPGAQPPRRRPAVVPAPAADARLLGVPDGVDGPGPDERHLSGAVQPLPARPRHQGHLRPARVGVPRRRRDGRAGEPRAGAGRGARGPGQPDLRRSTATCSASTARCAATARSSRSWSRSSAAPAGTSSRWSGAASGTPCCTPTRTARWST